MKVSARLSILSASLLLVGCLGPQTYFSEVFNQIYDTYYPTKDNANRLVANYAVNATISSQDKTITYDVFLFETGIQLTHISSQVHEEVLTTRTLTVIYDYAEGGTFMRQSYANNPIGEEKVYTAFTSQSFELFDRATDTIDQVFTEQTKSLINNQATNLIIGGEPTSQDVKTYTLPVGNFVDLATFSQLVGFTPTSLQLDIIYTTSTQETLIEMNASGDAATYFAEIKLSQPGLIIPSQYLLSNTEKLTYQGYSAS